MGVPKLAAKKLKNILEAELRTLKDALHSHLLHKISALNGFYLFPKAYIRSHVMMIRDGLIKYVYQRLDGAPNVHAEVLQN